MNQLSLLTPDGKPTLEAARSARDAGMQQALDHANDKTPQWSETALAYLKMYSKNHEHFVGWFVTNEAELSGAIDAPPTRKAWGSIFTAAVRRGWIEKSGYRQDPNRHCNPAPLWRSLIYRP